MERGYRQQRDAMMRVLGREATLVWPVNRRLPTQLDSNDGAVGGGAGGSGRRGRSPPIRANSPELWQMPRAVQQGSATHTSNSRHNTGNITNGSGDSRTSDAGASPTSSTSTTSRYSAGGGSRSAGDNDAVAGGGAEPQQDICSRGDGASAHRRYYDHLLYQHEHHKELHDQYQYQERDQQQQRQQEQDEEVRQLHQQLRQLQMRKQRRRQQQRQQLSFSSTPSPTTAMSMVRNAM